MTLATVRKPMHDIELGSLVQNLGLGQGLSRPIYHLTKQQTKQKASRQKVEMSGLLREIGSRRYYIPERMKARSQASSEIKAAICA